MRRLVARQWFAVACGAMLGACSLGQASGGLVMLDKDYDAAVFADNDDGITSPDGLAWYRGGLLIADEGGSAIRWIGPKGIETWADASSGMLSPEDLAVARDGTIYFSDDSAGGLWAVIGQGGAERLSIPGAALPSTEGIAITPEGILWIGDGKNGAMYAVRPDGKGRGARLGARRMTKPESMAFDAAGNMYAADNSDDVLYRFDAGPGARRQIVHRHGFSPESIAMIGTSLWITDSDHGKLYRLEENGALETVAIFGGELENLSGIAGDPAGNVYVAIQSDLHHGKGLIVRLRMKR